MIGNDTLAGQTVARVKRASLASISLRDLNPGESKVYSVASSVDATTPNISIESDHILDSQEIQFTAGIKVRYIFESVWWNTGILIIYRWK